MLEWDEEIDGHFYADHAGETDKYEVYESDDGKWRAVEYTGDGGVLKSPLFTTEILAKFWCQIRASFNERPS